MCVCVYVYVCVSFCVSGVSTLALSEIVKCFSCKEEREREIKREGGILSCMRIRGSVWKCTIHTHKKLHHQLACPLLCKREVVIVKFDLKMKKNTQMNTLFLFFLSYPKKNVKNTQIIISKNSLQIILTLHKSKKVRVESCA